MQHIIDRFISYVTIDTESDPNSETTPSTEKQWNLANKLVEELKAIGMKEVTIDKHSYVMATLPSNVEHEVPTIGFVAHFDTTPDFTGKDVNTLTAHYDILPTLIDLCGLKTDSNMIFDGTSLVPLIKTNTNKFVNRIVITNSQRNEFPEKWKRSATMQGKWRLINGQELYNLDSDPEQRTDVSIQFSDKREELKQAYSKWWEEIKQSIPCRI